MIQGYNADHPEGVMHGGVSSGEHAYHVVVAVFDSETGERIEDATVEADVAPLGLGPVHRQLDRMVIADAATYGNYFTMRGDGFYKISLSITASRFPNPVVLEFTYEHRTR